MRASLEQLTLRSENRGIYLEDLTGGRSASGRQPRASDSAKFEL